MSSLTDGTRSTRRRTDASSIRSRQALATLPVTRKHELLERQKALRASDPFDLSRMQSEMNPVQAQGIRNMSAKAKNNMTKFYEYAATVKAQMPPEL